MTGITINTVARRVILDPEATVLETLRRVQFDQSEISKHEHITLADLLSDGIPVSGLFKTLLNLSQHVGEQGTIMDNPNDVDIFGNRRSDFRDRCATCLYHYKLCG